ncbi:hypothetical protein [Phenylobacterium sp.]|uniref:hypothetical protein n=1 Tax=Phenylobacterium sp. TaxID=1871053 RepID=UPI002C8AA060|nr:hypothetical protein [Phenylobacterium sp.]HLZ73858.1 hypothetical protein [Phenylobacterium sp.]
MDIHKPKPWHNVREFLKEYVIIVVGVLTALGAEQAAERLHWAHEVKIARAEIAKEMSWTDRHFAYRVAAEPCIGRRLDALEAVIEKAAAHQPVPRLGPVIPDIGNALNDNIWQNHRAAQTLTHFDDQELNLLSSYYMQVNSVRGFYTDEVAAWSVLKVLQGDPARLGPTDVAGLRVAVQRARFDNGLIANISADELQWAKALHVAAPAPDARRLKDVCGPLPVLGAS